MLFNHWLAEGGPQGLVHGDTYYDRVVKKKYSDTYLFLKH